MSAAPKAKPAAPKPQGGLSSGLLGMKFMQKDDSTTPTAPSSRQQTPDSESTDNTHKYQHDKDPGEWFGPLSSRIKSTTPSSSTKTLSYSDIYRQESATPVGRRSYGVKPQVADPEEMAKGYKTDEKPPKKSSKKSRAKDSRDGSPNTGRKRLSESGPNDSPPMSKKKRRN